MTQPLTTRSGGIINLTHRFGLTALAESDLVQVMAIERDSFPHPWTRDGFLISLRADFGRAWALLDQSRRERTVVGYLCCWVKPEGVQVVNICVARSYREQGLGRAMMEFLTARCRRKKAPKIILEVRPGNEAAINLYESLGFVRTGVVPGYYEDTGEAAWLFELNPGPGGDGQKSR